MRNILVLFTTVIILLAGSSSVEAQHKRGSNGNHTGCCQGEKSASDRAEHVASRLKETLNLSNKQSEKVQTIYLDFFQERETYLENNKKGEKPRKGKDGKGKGYREPDAECVARYKDLDAKLAKVLNEDQMTEYDRMKNKLLIFVPDK